MVKKLRTQLIVLIIGFVLLFTGTIVSVWANVIGNRKIELGGDVIFDVADKTLYVKDVRIKDGNTLSGAGTTVTGFVPGYINGSFAIDLGSYTSNTGSFTVYFDVVNCSGTTFQPKVTSQPTNATASASGTIAGDNVSPTNVSTAPISGTITLEVVASSSPATIDLSQITIEIEEFNFEALSNNTSLGTASYTGTVGIGNEVTLTAEFAGPNAEFLGWATDNNGIDSNFVSDSMEYTMTISEDSAEKYYAIYQTLNASGISYTLTSFNSTASAKKTSISSPSGSVKIPSAIYSGSRKYDVTRIGSAAFSGCTGLTSITIPNSITSIGDSAFRSCSGLTSITVDEGNTKYHSSGNCIIETDSKTLIAGCKTSVIPDDGSVTSIGSYAFRYCRGLTSITIGNSVTSIGSYAFSDCSGLTSITIGNSVTSIGSYAFSGCSGLTSVTIGNSVTSIGSYAFSGCSGLTSVTIGNSVTSIGSYAFSDCSGLTSITVDEGNTKYHCSGNCIIETESKTLIAGCKTSVIPDDGSVTSIGSYAFSGCSGLTSITIPNSVTSISEGTFWYCSGLTSITVDEGNTKYHSSGNCLIETDSKTLIAGCKTSDIPNDGTVTSIGSSAFLGCSGLTSITIPSFVTSIGKQAFSSCSKLTSVTFNNTTGWQVSTSSSFTSVTEIDFSDLSNSATAATYLTSNYKTYYWRRVEA